MQQYELQAYGLDEAKMKAYQQYQAIVIRDITKKWFKNNKPTGYELLMMVAEYMEEEDLFLYENSAVIIATVYGQYKATREYAPYRPKKRIGRCKTKRKVEVRSIATNQVYGIADTKTEALSLAKELMSQYKEDLYGKTVYVAEDVDFILKFKQPKVNMLGTYMIFKVEAEDVRLRKRKDMGFE